MNNNYYNNNRNKKSQDEKITKKDKRHCTPKELFFIILNDIEREVSIIIFPMIRLLK